MSGQLFHIALSMIEGVGPITARKLVSHCGSPEAVFKSKRRELLGIEGIGSYTVDRILDQVVLKKAEKEIEFLNGRDISCVSYLDKDYPFRLKPFPDSPVLIYFQGKYVFNNPRCIGIVGTRRPTERGVWNCEKVIDEIKDYQPVIVSGLAYGIDAIAHRRSLKNCLSTLGVMGNGLAHTYPAAHKNLRRKMLENGAVLSEFPSGTGPEREHFPMRNRIIAALCDAVLVIESAKKGGSMITAQFAFAYNKDVFGIPGRPEDGLSAGPNYLIKSQVAGLVENGYDLADKMMWEKDNRKKTNQLNLFASLDERESKLVEWIRNTEDATPSIDYLIYESKWNPNELSSVLLRLELKGVLKSLPGSRIALMG